MDQIAFDLPWPPSVNTYWRSVQGRNILSETGRRYKKDAALFIMLAGSPKHVGRCRVRIVLHPPDLRERDSDNYSKAIFDALVEGGVIEGDSNRTVIGNSVEWSEKSTNPRASITIEAA